MTHKRLIRPEKSRPAAEKPVSLKPLSVEDALKGLLQVKPSPDKPKRGGKKKTLKLKLGKPKT